MRTLHVLPSLAESDGGPPAALRSMEQALAAVGVKVEVASTCATDLSTEMTTIEHDVRGGRRRHLFRRDTTFYKVSIPFVRWMLAHVREYDLVHVHALFSFTSVVAAWAARRATVPYVIRPLGALNAYGMRKHRPLFKRLSFTLLEGSLLRDAAAVHFTSDAERAEAEGLGAPMRSVVIQLALPDEAFIAPLKAEVDQHLLVFLSRLDPKKNVEGLLDAVARVAAVRPALRLAVAGAGENAYEQALKAKAQSLGIAAHVEWLGDVRGEAKAELLSRAAAFALPSYSENFGIAVAEALAAGVPCVVSRGVALARLVEQAGAGVVTGTDGASIAAGIDAVLGDAQRRSRMGEAARDVARREFSSAVMGQRLRALYERVLARPAS
ncbi:MAG TPA: glycosyltransferase [Verrucomicrobiae bacterium]|nr:glycosyltransferase [Verrucomicrobiae bacterium]